MGENEMYATGYENKEGETRKLKLKPERKTSTQKNNTIGIQKARSEDSE
jgi:hypothetical protein